MTEERTGLKTLQHTIEPVFCENSKILILGTFPSVKSREVAFFYGHPRNRFWKVIAESFDKRVPETIDEKKQLILESNLAVWDVIASCQIIGSSDSSIKNVVPNDINQIIRIADIKKIILNGKTAYKLYKKYLEQDINIPTAVLPSTSPANAGITQKDLTDRWKKELLSIE